MDRFTDAAAYLIKQQFSKVLYSSLTIYVMAILLKLFYFNYETGLHRIAPIQLLTTLGSVFILISFAFLLKYKNAGRYILLIDGMLSFIMFCDLVFYRYFNDLISIPLLFQAGNIGDIKNSILELLHPGDLLFIADLIILPGIQRKRKRQEQNLMSIGGKSGKKALLFCVSGMLMVYVGTAQLVHSQPTILQTFYDRVYVAQNIGLLNYHAADAYRFVAQNINEDSTLSEDQQKEIMSFFSEKQNNNQERGLLFGAGKGKNIIVIQVEALQQFVIQRSINGQEITPNLNKLIAKSIYFDNYYYQTAGGGTSDAEFTTNVSMYPMKEGAVYIRKPGNYYYSLPQRLKEEGYGTIAMHGYKPGFWNRSVMYNSLGFDKFVSKTHLREDELLGMGISDKAFMKQALAKLKAHKEPYFAYLITLSSHFPYDNDKSLYSSFDVGEYKDTLVGNYLEAIHYTDEALGLFIEELESSGLMENTVLAVYGDHHAIAKDDMSELAGFMGKESLNELEWQQLQKVPLIIHLPGSTEPQVVSTAGGGTDFMPTLLNIAGIDVSNMVYMGRDLVNAKEGFVVFRNGSFVTDKIAYISNTNTAYDVKTGMVIAPERFNREKALAEKYLQYSDAIIDFDLIDDIREYLEKEKP